MNLVTTTVSSTLFWKNGSLAGLCVLFLLFSLPGIGRAADTGVVEIAQLRAERTDEGLFLAAQMRMELPPLVEDALGKGVPMYFVAEAVLLRERWYWYDRKAAETARHMRLVYQPLTRRWRLNTSPEPLGTAGLGVSLTQNFDSLREALQAVQRIANWKIAEAAAFEPDAQHTIEFSFRLDVSQLPRPFQIGAAGQPEWSLAASRRLRLLPEAPK